MIRFLLDSHGDSIFLILVELMKHEDGLLNLLVVMSGTFLKGFSAFSISRFHRLVLSQSPAQRLVFHVRFMRFYVSFLDSHQV